MTAEQKDVADEIANVLGPPPDAFDASAVPSRMAETVLLRFLARVIHADETIATKEMTTLVSIAVALSMDANEAKLILDDEFERKSDVKILASQLPDQESRREAYAMGCMMCCADGDAADSEKQVLMDFADGAEIDRGEAESILAKLTARLVEAKKNV